MKPLVICFLLLAALRTPAFAGRVENPLFGYTHLLPSPFTVPSGRLVYGSTFAFGVTDFLQVGTDIIRDFYKVFNAQAKVSLVDYQAFAFGLNLEFSTYNLRDFSDSNPDTRFYSWLPGAVVALGLGERLALFIGGNVNYVSPKVSQPNVTSGYVRGTSVETDLSFAYNPITSSKGLETRVTKVGNALSAGVSYDLTFKLPGLGLSHHWPGFHLGVHYYPTATRNRYLPIVAGGGSIEI